eukprot:11177216-Lingulodinium_polyedra.AAC.1
MLSSEASLQGSASRKSTAIEALSVRQICSLSRVMVRWVNSDRQFADILTNKVCVVQSGRTTYHPVDDCLVCQLHQR